MYKYLIGAVVVIVIIMFFFVGRGNDELPASLIGEGVALYRVSFNNQETNRAYLHVPFEAESEVVRHINVGLDLNGDGVINTDSEDEWAVQNGVPVITEGESVRFPMNVPDRSVGREKTVDAIFFYSKDPLTPEAIQRGESDLDFITERAQVDSLIVDDMDAVLHIDEEGNKRTGPVADTLALFSDVVRTNTVYAQEDGRPDYYSSRHEDVPDQDQEYNECSPTSVANSFTWLAQKYGFEDLMPEDIGSTIDELKADLEWDSGTSDKDIIPGKQLFVDRHNLPIEVHQIGDQNDSDIHWKIYEEMEKGQAVEVSLQFYTRDANGEKKKAGGHMVTVTGVSGGPDHKSIRFSDSATDSGEGGSGDYYEVVDGNKLKWFWTDKEVEIEFAYAQSPIQSVIDGTWTMPSGSDFLVGENHALNLGGDVVSKGVSRFGFFNSFIDHPGDHFLGERFTVVATVVMRDGERQYMFWTDDNGESQAYWHAAKGPWTLDGVITGGGPLSPARLVGRPTKTTVDGDRYRLEQEFVCVKPGFAKVTYEANVTWTIEDGDDELPSDTRTRYEEQLTPSASFTINSPIFQCLTTDPSQIDEPSGVSLSDPEPVCNGVVPDPDGVEVEVLKIGGECYPRVQFREGSAQDPCKALHWHAGKVTSLTGVEMEDPNPDACGFGKIGEVPEDKVMIDLQTASKYLGNILDDVDLSEPEIEYGTIEFNYKGYGDGWQYQGIEYEVEIETVTPSAESADGARSIEVRGLEGLRTR